MDLAYRIKAGPMPCLGSTESVKSSLESKFPRIAEEIARLWGWWQCEPYLSGLIINERPDRHGFDTEIMEELLMLHGVCWHLSHMAPSGPLARDGEFNFVANFATH